MNKTYIIDQRIGEIYNGIFFVYKEPQIEDEYDENVETDCLFVQAMKSLTEGHSQDGKKLLEQAYSKGSVRAGHVLSYGYSCGWFGERDHNTQIKILRQLQHYNYPNALNDLGCAYEFGLGVRKNIRIALSWYHKAVSKGSIFAISNLAYIYIFGPEKYRDKYKGVYYAFCAAFYDDEQAQNLLGLCYEFGIGLDKDYEMAFDYYKKAVEGGAGPCAEYNLSLCYSRGVGTDVDLEKGEKYMRLAMEHGYKPKNKPNL